MAIVRYTKQFRCPYCERTFSDFNKFIQHLTAKHDVYFIPFRQEDLLKLQQFILNCGLLSECSLDSEIIKALRIGEWIMRNKNT